VWVFKYCHCHSWMFYESIIYLRSTPVLSWYFVLWASMISWNECLVFYCPCCYFVGLRPIGLRSASSSSAMTCPWMSLIGLEALNFLFVRMPLIIYCCNTLSRSFKLHLCYFLSIGSVIFNSQALPPYLKVYFCWMRLERTLISLNFP
jgi:hypothetical protein